MEDPNELARKEERTDSVFKMFQSAFQPKKKIVYVWLRNNNVIGYNLQLMHISGKNIEQKLINLFRAIFYFIL